MPLTDTLLKSLKPAPAGTSIHHQDKGTGAAPGLAIRVNSRGNRTFVLLGVRFPGSVHPTKAPLGDYETELTLEQAREKARAWRAAIKSGVDPRQAVAAEAAAADTVKAEAKRANERLFENVAADFRRLVLVGPDEASPKQRTGRATAREIDTHFTSQFRGRPLASISRQEITAVIDGIVERGTPAHAHNMLGHVRRLCNWAIARDRYGVEHSPCDRIKPKALIGAKVHRARTLSDDELLAFWRVASRLAYPFGPALKLLILLGQRRSEIGDMRWSELDLNRGILTISGERMKAKSTHVLPLPAAAVALLASLPRWNAGDHVFSTTGGRTPVSGWSKIKHRLDAAMLAELRAMALKRGGDPEHVEMKPFVLHDLRRTMRTHLSALPVQDIVRELVIAHTRPGLHKVYDQHAYAVEKREALELWSARLTAIVEPPPPNVVPIRAEKAA